MPRSGQKGLSKAERDEATKVLDAKLKSLAMAIEERNVVEPDRDLMLKFLDQKDLEACWQRLAKARGRAPADIKETWEDLKRFPFTASQQTKLSTLGKFVMSITGLHPPTAWQEHLETVTEEIKHIQSMARQRPRTSSLGGS